MKEPVPTTIIDVRCLSGPLDGHYGPKKVSYIPGTFPRFGHNGGKYKYVYQAMGFIGDGTPLTFVFVQVVGLKDDIFED